MPTRRQTSFAFLNVKSPSPSIASDDQENAGATSGRHNRIASLGGMQPWVLRSSGLRVFLTCATVECYRRSERWMTHDIPAQDPITVLCNQSRGGVNAELEPRSSIEPGPALTKARVVVHNHSADLDAGLPRQAGVAVESIHLTSFPSISVHNPVAHFPGCNMLGATSLAHCVRKEGVSPSGRAKGGGGCIFDTRWKSSQPYDQKLYSHKEGCNA